MRIELEKYNPNWITQFYDLKNQLSIILEDLNPIIEHIGSTSVQFLSAKPIIDIAVGIKSISELDLAIKPMMKNQFIYYEVYNKVMPERRLFVGLKDKKDFDKFQNIYSYDDEIPHKRIQMYKLSHIHIWEFESDEWKRHIAFRDYLNEHVEIGKRYSHLKNKLSKRDWVDVNEYNDAKNDFIKQVESQAILWYDGRN